MTDQMQRLLVQELKILNDARDVLQQFLVAAKTIVSGIRFKEPPFLS